MKGWRYREGHGTPGAFAHGHYSPRPLLRRYPYGDITSYNSTRSVYSIIQAICFQHGDWNLSILLMSVGLSVKNGLNPTKRSTYCIKASTWESTNAISSGEYNLNELYLDYVDPDILGGLRHKFFQVAVMQCLKQPCITYCDTWKEPQKLSRGP